MSTTVATVRRLLAMSTIKLLFLLTVAFCVSNAVLQQMWAHSNPVVADKWHSIPLSSDARRGGFGDRLRRWLWKLVVKVKEQFPWVREEEVLH
jgi:hypothetical protein